MFKIMYVSTVYLLQKGHHLKADFVFDWRDKGVISPVSDQGQMGDSVAFAIAGMCYIKSYIYTYIHTYDVAETPDDFKTGIFFLCV